MPSFAPAGTRSLLKLVTNRYRLSAVVPQQCLERSGLLLEAVARQSFFFKLITYRAGRFLKAGDRTIASGRKVETPVHNDAGCAGGHQTSAPRMNDDN